MPPLLADYYKSHRRTEGFFGEYPTYEDAAKVAGRYSDEFILEGIKDEYQRLLKKKQEPNIALLEGAIQYTENPYFILGQIVNCNFDYILFNRTPLIRLDRDIIKVQKVSSALYGRPISHPVWMLSENKFLRAFERYNLFASLKTAPPSSDKRCSYNFMMFERKNL